jgi:hypothetical protein
LRGLRRLDLEVLERVLILGLVIAVVYCTFLRSSRIFRSLALLHDALHSLLLIKRSKRG